MTLDPNMLRLSADYVAPAEDAVAVTPSDTTDLAHTCRALYVGVAGNVTIITPGGSTTALVGVAAGSVLPIRATRVKATGTTATSIVALY